jgi:glycosyltransferase involved in cell wall biosynthesis
MSNFKSDKIVIVNQSTGYLTIDVINCFANKFSKVDLIYGEIREEKHPLNSNVSKVRVAKKTRKSNFGRLIKWGIASIQIHFLLLTKFRKHEILYYSLPPFAYLGALFLNRKFSIMIFDVYPDILKTVGKGEENPIYKVWAYLNKRVFKRAHRIFTIGEGLKSKLAEYIDDERINNIPLWATLSGTDPIPKSENIFLKDHNIEDKFIVQYSGNIGQTHNIEILVELAERLKNFGDIHFVIIGRGTKIPSLKAKIGSMNLNNIQVLPFQPNDMIKYSLSGADIGVVLIDKNAAQMSVPSKTFNMMAMGSVILALAPNESELNRLINLHKNGACIDESEISKIENFILEVYKNEDIRRKFKNNSLNGAEMYTEKNAEKILKIYTDQEKYTC